VGTSEWPRRALKGRPHRLFPELVCATDAVAQLPTRSFSFERVEGALLGCRPNLSVGILRRRSVAGLYLSYFAFVGAFSPYLALWFSAQGMSITQIAILMAMPQALRVVAPPFWGWLADRSGQAGRLLQCSAAVALVAVLALGQSDGFSGLVWTMFVLFFATSAQGPLTESLTLGLVRGDPGQYGRIRLWGSVGFILAVTATGPLLDHAGINRLPDLMAVLAALVLVAALQIPALAARESEPSPVRLRDQLREPAVLALFTGAFWMVFAHAALYSFYSLHLEKMGYSRSLIGLLWATGVAVEILFFRFQHSLFARFDPRRLLSISFAVAVLRFGLIAAAGPDLVLLVIGQVLHGVTFGVHHSASLALLHRSFAHRGQAAAQAIYVAVSYGVGGTLGGLAAAWLWEWSGPRLMWTGAACAAVLGWLAARRC